MYKRVLLKISGNFFSDQDSQGLDFTAISQVAAEVGELHKQGIQIAIVNGAGNIFRGRSRPDGFDRVAADQLGFISTLPNSLALTEVLNASGIDTRLMSSITIPGIASHFDAFKARRLLNENKILILTGGTGHPFFTTDTTAVLRALEIQADILLKATDVEGVYSADPSNNPDAKKYDRLTFKEALDKKLQIMDQTAFALAAENELPILVFKFQPDALSRILQNPAAGTIITA